MGQTPNSAVTVGALLGIKRLRRDAEQVRALDWDPEQPASPEQYGYICLMRDKLPKRTLLGKAAALLLE
jgi:hypothetical protein